MNIESNRSIFFLSPFEEDGEWPISFCVETKPRRLTEWGRQCVSMREANDFEYWLLLPFFLILNWPNAYVFDFFYSSIHIRSRLKYINLRVKGESHR